MKLLGVVIFSAAVMDVGKLVWIVSELPCS